jgi:sRNA-binding regulator protein Hfq
MSNDFSFLLHLERCLFKMISKKTRSKYEMAALDKNMTGERQPTEKARSSYEFIPALKGKKIIIRLLSGGQPVTGTLESYNPYELQIQTAKGSQLVFKRAIATIEAVEWTPGGSDGRK